jgi:phage major head subunit gpT-like protein
MNTNTEKFKAMVTAFDLAFKNAFEGAPDISGKFAMTVGDSAHQIVELPFFEAFTFMRKWIGDRQIKNLQGAKLTLREDGFEDTIGISERDFECDNWSLYANAVRQMGENAAALWDRLATEALVNAGTWIDGKAFFATDRKYGKSTIGNKTTSALSASTFNTAYEAMQSYKGHNGEPMCVTPDTLMVGPKNRKTAFDIINANLISDGTTTVDNPNKGLVDVIVNPRLVGDAEDYWFLMKAKGAIKPVALQKSRAPRLTVLDKATDESVFMRGDILVGSDAYGSAAAAFPHLVYAGIL